MKFVQGGSTGLVQQKVKSYPQKRKPTEYYYIDVKDTIKSKSDIELVLIAGGINFHTFEEDARLMNKEFGHKIHDQGGYAPYNMTSFRKSLREVMIRKIKSRDIKYALVDIVDSQKMIREIVDSSDKDLIGLKFWL